VVVRLNSERGMTVPPTTHEMVEAETLCHRVGFGASPHWSVVVDAAALMGFTLAFGWLALLLHRRTLRR